MEQPRPQNVSEAAPPAFNDANFAKLVTFRFGFAYLLLYSLPFPLNVIPGLSFINNAYDQFWEVAARWFARVVLRVPYDLVSPGGSGDTTFNYVQVLMFVLLSGIACAIWSLLDRRRKGYPKLHEWLRVYVRYVLFVTMLSYGLAKVFLLQFPSPHLDRLLQPYGESSPMGLLWTFIGASSAYQFFAGLSEVVGGMLLIFRRTTMLGALVTGGVMLNVVMLNFCYDVPVKLYSAHLLLMCVFLLVPDLKRLFNFLIANKTVPPAPIAPLFQKPVWHALSVVLWVFFVGNALYGQISGRADRASAPDRIDAKFVGEYDIISFSRNGVEQPPLITDKTQWRRFRIAAWGGAAVTYMEGNQDRFILEHDAAVGAFKLRPFDDRNALHAFIYSGTPDGEFALKGTLLADELTIKLKKSPERKFLLTTRGFNWINERPFNR